MELYWKLENIPELAPLSKAQRTEVWVATIGPKLRSKDSILALVVFLFFMACFGLIGGSLIPGRYGTMIGCLVAYIPGALLFWGYILPKARPSLAAEVERRRERGMIP